MSPYPALSGVKGRTPQRGVPTMSFVFWALSVFSKVFGEDAEHGDRDGRAPISVAVLEDSETGGTPGPLFLRRCCASISEMRREAVLSL